MCFSIFGLCFITSSRNIFKGWKVIFLVPQHISYFLLLSSFAEVTAALKYRHAQSSYLMAPAASPERHDQNLAHGGTVLTTSADRQQFGSLILPAQG